jgi:1-acyl-sn-glycerol-3-phosphate acyltransferase
VKAADKRGRPAYGPQSPGWFFAHLIRNTAGRLALAVYRTRFIGVENVPAGGAILAGNHVSYLDPVILWCGSPRPTHFMTKSELWQVGWLGWALDQFWAFPVERATADRDAIATGTRLLQNGELLGVFPEGTRKRDSAEDLGEAHGGGAFMALRAGVPIVPVGFIGTDEAWPAGRKFPRIVKVTVRYGEPVWPEDFEGSRKERMAAMTAEVMRRIDLERRGSREA